MTQRCGYPKPPVGSRSLVRNSLLNKANQLNLSSDTRYYVTDPGIEHIPVKELLSKVV